MTTPPTPRPDDEPRDLSQRETYSPDTEVSQVDESHSLRNRLSLDSDRDERVGADRLGDDRIGNDRLGDDRIGNDRIGNDRLGDDPTRAMPTYAEPGRARADEDDTRVMPTRDTDSTQVMHAPTGAPLTASAAAPAAATGYDVRDSDVQRLDRVNDDGKGPHQRDLIRSAPARFTLALLRIGMGFYFLWAFLDKLVGLGYATPEERAWVNGGSPTRGFLSNANPEGPLSTMFRDMAGQAWVDWLFMIGLAGIGIALILGVATRFASFMGLVLVTMMYLAVWPVGHSVAWAAAGEGRSASPNPFVDSHIVEALVFLVLMTTYAGDYLGLGKAWRKVVGNSILR